MTAKSFWLKPYIPLTGPCQMQIVGGAVRNNDLLTISYELLGALGQAAEPATSTAQAPQSLALQPLAPHPLAPQPLAPQSLAPQPLAPQSVDLTAAHRPVDLTAAHRPVDCWQVTHLKCFIAPADTSVYWEIQLQPSYDWVKCGSASPFAWDFHISRNHDWTVLRYEDYRLTPRLEHDMHTASYSLHASPQVLHTSLKIDLSKLGLCKQPLNVGISAVAKLAAQRTNYWALAYPESGPDFHHPESFALPV